MSNTASKIPRASNKKESEKKKKGGEAKKQKPDGEGGEGRWGGRERESK